MDSWLPLDDAPPLLDELVVDDLSLVAEVTHPLRSRILHRLHTPQSAAELAAVLEVPVTRLYHHLHRLRALGLIVVVATRRSGARTEQRYRLRARSFRIDPDLTTHSQADIERTTLSLFDVVRTELQREFDLGALDPHALRDHSTLGMSTLLLTEEQRAELQRRLSALIAEFGDHEALDPAAPGVQRVRLLAALFTLSD